MNLYARPGGTRAEGKIKMKVKQFLNKFLYASSSIKFVYMADQAGHEIPVSANVLSDPMNKEFSDREELNSTVRSFQIKGDSLVIYCN